MSDDAKAMATAPMPSEGCPELGLLMAEAADNLHHDGSLFHAFLELAVNAWMAGHIEGEDHCTGCTERGAGGHDWPARQEAVLDLFPNAQAFLHRSIWNAAMHDGTLLPARDKQATTARQ